MKKVYVNAQWQGGADRSTYDGAEELRKYLPGQDYVILPVSTEEAEMAVMRNGIRDLMFYTGRCSPLKGLSPVVAPLKGALKYQVLAGENNMNVYDFDKTIYPGDCSIGFCFWCMNRHPKLWFTFFPKVLINLVRRKMGLMPEYLMQRKFFGYLMLIDDFDEQIKQYWDKNEKKIVSWYLKQKRPDDLIISASPTCIIEPIANRLGVNFMATEFDREYGVFVNNLMYAKEKAKYIIDHGFPVIDNFYSDSLSDTPLALCAEKAHLVTNNASTVIDWPDLDAETMGVVKEKINTGWRIHLK